MTHKGTCEIQTERLLLRRFTVNDAQKMYENWAKDEEVTHFLTWPAHKSVNVTRMILESWVNGYEKPNVYQWAIALQETPEEPIGSIAVVALDENIKKAEVGYALGKPWWHQGIMSEALNAVIWFLIKNVGFNRIEARHDANNPRSGAVMKRCGMTYEGTLRLSDKNNQGICDACWYSILAEEK